MRLLLTVLASSSCIVAVGCGGSPAEAAQAEAELNATEPPRCTLAGTAAAETSLTYADGTVRTFTDCYYAHSVVQAGGVSLALQQDHGHFMLGLSLAEIPSVGVIPLRQHFDFVSLYGREASCPAPACMFQGANYTSATLTVESVGPRDGGRIAATLSAEVVLVGSVPGPIRLTSRFVSAQLHP